MVSCGTTVSSSYVRRHCLKLEINTLKWGNGMSVWSKLSTGPPRFVSNLTAEKEADDTMVFSVEAAEGSSPISYRLLIDNTIHNKAVELSEGENIQLKINISSLVSSVSIITVVASNEDRNGHRHATAIGSVVITQQG